MGVAKMLSLIVALCSPAFCVASMSGLPSFPSFIAKYGRAYNAGTKEYEERHSIFKRSLEHVHHHNSKHDRLWSATINHLSDRTEVELAQLRGLRAVQGAKRAAGVVGLHGNRGQFLSQIKSSVVPEEKSWAHLSAVNQDVDQGGCGSCWALATSIMLQANAEIVGINRTFSMQELVDCVPNTNNCGGAGGCQGATVELGMNWIMAQGLDDASGTPYVGSDQSCKKKSVQLLSGVQNEKLEDMIAVGFHPASLTSSPVSALGIQGWERLPENEYEPLIRAVAERGPVAVSVGASGWSSYGAGLFNSCGQDSTIDHAVTLIGYGTDKEKNQKYWHIKNSWGNSWGENGDIRLFREEGNAHCGTDYQPKAGTGCDGGPSSVHVCGMCGILYDNVVAHFAKP